MQNINEMQDGDITIFRYCPCKKKYVKKENDDEVMLSKEEWAEQNKKKATAIQEEIMQRLDVLKTIRARKEKQMSKQNKPFQSTKKLNEIKKQFHEIRTQNQL